MTAEAGERVVSIPRPVSVLGVHGGAVVFVTDQAGERRVTAAALMARHARLTMRTRIDRETMTEGRLIPRRVGCAMTTFARRRESSGNVVRRGRPVVQRAMTADAVARCSDVHVIDVARGTRDLRMPAHEGIEGMGGRSPEARIARPVTCLTCRGESRRYVIRRLCGPVVFVVTRNARRLDHLERVALMARLA